MLARRRSQPPQLKKIGRRFDHPNRVAPKIARFASLLFMVLFVVVLFLYHRIVTHHMVQLNGTNDSGLLLPLSIANEHDHMSISDNGNQPPHHVAGLSCQKYGGPTSDAAIKEMIYWYHIPADNNYQSDLLHRTGKMEGTEDERYLTFEPDEGGWNNIRMALETTIAIAISMGRTLVLPPDMKYYLLWDDHKKHKPPGQSQAKKNKNVMNFDDFFHLESIQREYPNVLRIIRMEDFLARLGETGQLRNRQNVVLYPNRTNWSSSASSSSSSSSSAIMNNYGSESHSLWEYIRDVTQPLQWDSDNCVAVFPSSTTLTLSDLTSHDINIVDADTQRQFDYLKRVFRSDKIKYGDRLQQLPPHKRRLVRLYQYRQLSYRDHPTPVNATAVERLAEILANRNELCVYNQSMHQKYKVLHITGSETVMSSTSGRANQKHTKGQEITSHRLLIHFYAFLFYENYHTDLFIKRFIRDHLRYIDEIQCGAARIIEAIRDIARSNHKRITNTNATATNSTGPEYDSFHIRRGDFQYDLMHLSAQEIYDGTTRAVVPDGRTVYIATDEKNLRFFQAFQQHYNVLFLRNFTHLIADINPNYYGMIDQLVASKSEVFVGTFFSTFSGYINRLRGYHAQRNQLPGYELGHIQSYYYLPDKYARFRHIMQSYSSVQQNFWQQEFPVAWRDINHDVTGDIIQ